MHENLGVVICAEQKFIEFLCVGSSLCSSINGDSIWIFKGSTSKTFFHRMTTKINAEFQMSNVFNVNLYAIFSMLAFMKPKKHYFEVNDFSFISNFFKNTIKRLSNHIKLNYLCF